MVRLCGSFIFVALLWSGLYINGMQRSLWYSICKVKTSTFIRIFVNIEVMVSLWESHSAVKSWRHIGERPETQNANSDDTICPEFKNCLYFQFPEYYCICIIVAIILWHIYSNIYIAGVPWTCASICLPISGMIKTFLFYVKRHLKLQKI